MKRMIRNTRDLFPGAYLYAGYRIMALNAYASPDQWLNFGHADHVQLLHGSHDQQVTVAYRDPTGWHEHSTADRWATNTTLELLIARGNEAYLSQSGFNRSRRSLESLSTIPALFTDLDYGDVPTMRRLTTPQLFERIRRDLPDLPPPTLTAASSLRGAYGVWVLNEPLPADQLPVWQPVQNTLCSVLKPYGADFRARDATRVLRVPGSRHSSGAVVRYEQTGPCYEFATLQRAIAALAPSPQIPTPTAQRTTQAGKRPARLFNRYSLAYGRMDDLRLIARNRGPLTDCSKRFLFTFSVCAAWFKHSAEELARECEYFAADHFKDGHRYNRRMISTTLRRFDQAQTGVRVPCGSPHGIVEVDPRYRLRNETIREWLELDNAELQNCKVIIPAELKRERHAAHEAERRRRRGAKERAEYLAAPQARRQQALVLIEQGLPVPQIAEQLGCSRRRIEQIRNGG